MKLGDGEINLMVMTEVFCTLQIPGIHNWPGCPHDDVAYLRDPHRHMFHIKAYKPVFHDDRDTEFILLRNSIYSYILNNYPLYSDNSQFGGCCDFGAMSCEMLARELIDQFKLSQCEVSEDNENGAIMTARRA